MVNPFKLALEGKEHDHTPVWFMRQAGRYMESYRQLRKIYTMEQICHLPDISSKIAYEAASYLETDAAIIFSDIMTPLENLGYKIRYIENVGPVPEKYNGKPVTFISNSANAIRHFVNNYRSTPVIGFIGGPLTLASYIVSKGPDRELKHTKTELIKRENELLELLNEITEIVIRDALSQIEAGAKVIQIFDSWLGFLDSDYVDMIIKNTVSKITEEIRNKGAKSIYFSTGTSGMLESVKMANADFLSLDWKCSLKEISENYGNIGLQGNLDPTILSLSLDRSIERSIKIIREMRDHKKFIFNLGHGILPETNPENVRILVKKIHEVIQ